MIGFDDWRGSKTPLTVFGRPSSSCSEGGDRRKGRIWTWCPGSCAALENVEQRMRVRRKREKGDIGGLKRSVGKRGIDVRLMASVCCCQGKPVAALC